ncbi:ankyrin repeat domain-containing protein SOWAHC-like isoform X2 [Cygnus olor]|uniref:ankyrin repeat domain-containing protein SOWAHC-like isoform X2 n=1 Tax=Cygnus olor TaxID=8869 RepID=UPI001ADEB033|nr:ankyrin repeat domain-containing protein SOWAHC-like isoform X2 [Cygnus olor]
MAAGPSRAECQGHGAAGGLPPSTAAPDTVALCQGSPAGAEALGAVPPQILVTDFSAANPGGWHCPDPQPEPGEEDSEQDAREASEDGSSSVGASPVALDPVEKEWLQGAAGGDLPVLSHLLQQEPALATKKDFTSGFTALHWAAKHGKEDMAAMLVDAGADINMRAHGYTPLHIAALHGHRQIVDLLIERFGAKQNLRDYSGHLAGHYLGSAGTLDGDPDTPQLPSGRGERGRNRRLACLLLPKAGGQARRRWGSAEDLAEPEEERAPAQLLAPPASYRAVRKFSR